MNSIAMASAPPCRHRTFTVKIWIYPMGIVDDYVVAQQARSSQRAERSHRVGVEFIGTARTADSSEAVTEVGPAVQPDYLHRLALAHERSGFDRVLVTHSSSEPDGFVVADQVLSVTAGVGVLLAHRPGFITPTLAARKLATLDALHPGRVALHVVTGGDDA